MSSDISYDDEEEVLQNTAAGSIFSPETRLSQKHLNSQRLWCPMGGPMLPPVKAGAQLRGQVGCKWLFSGVSASGDFL